MPGIGCILTEINDNIVVKKIMHGGPAHLCGRIGVGDVVLQMDDIPIVSLQTAIQIVSGKGSGSLITLLIRRVSDRRTELVKLVRQDVTLQISDEPSNFGISAALNVVNHGVRVDQVLKKL